MVALPPDSLAPPEVCAFVIAPAVRIPAEVVPNGILPKHFDVKTVTYSVGRKCNLNIIRLGESIHMHVAKKC
jgi:hypothetical protein